MKQTRGPLVIATIVGSILLPVQADEFHTSPACWTNARIYATSGEDHIEATVTRTETDLDLKGTLSANGAYRFAILGKLDNSDRDDYPRLVIYNERPYLLEIRFPYIKAVGKSEWVNENLLYLRLWWSRVAGTDLIVDVEQETIIYQHPIRYGETAFRQYKQCSQQDWKVEYQCQCPGYQKSEEHQVN